METPARQGIERRRFVFAGIDEAIKMIATRRLPDWFAGPDAISLGEIGDFAPMALSFRRKGMLIVVSAPSGGGKSTILRAVMNRMDGLEYSISATTRLPRAGEIDGRDYFFLSREEFQARIAEGGFLEHAEVHGNLYGTPRAEIERACLSGRDIVLDIDVQGGAQVKRRAPDAALIFILPPSLAELERRLRDRASDSPADIELRLRNARNEMRRWRDYDYAVINDDLERAVRDVEEIIRAERRRVSRLDLDEEIGES